MRIKTKTLTAATAAGLIVGALAGTNVSEVRAGNLNAPLASTSIASTVLRAPTDSAASSQVPVRAALTATYSPTVTLTALLFQDPSTIEGDPNSPEEAVIPPAQLAALERRAREIPTVADLGWSRTKGEQAVEFARRYIGFPYVWGGNGPIGYDCSGFTKHVFAQFGINLPRYSEDQVNAGPRVPASEAKPGDLMWWPGHVGIYTGNGNHIAARNPSVGIQEGPVYGDPVYIRLLPYDPTEEEVEAKKAEEAQKAEEARKAEEEAKNKAETTPTPTTPSPTTPAGPSPTPTPEPTSPTPTAPAPTNGSTSAPPEPPSPIPNPTQSPTAPAYSPEPSPFDTPLPGAAPTLALAPEE